MTYICVGKLAIIGSDNGLLPDRRQAIIWTNDGILLIGPLGTNFSEILIEIYTFSFKKVHLKMSSGKWRPFCLGLNVLIISPWLTSHIPHPHPNQYEYWHGITHDIKSKDIWNLNLFIYKVFNRYSCMGISYISYKMFKDFVHHLERRHLQTER